MVNNVYVNSKYDKITLIKWKKGGQNETIVRQRIGQTGLFISTRQTLKPSMFTYSLMLNSGDTLESQKIEYKYLIQMSEQNH